MEKSDTIKIYRMIALCITLGLIFGSLIVLFLEFVLDIDIRSKPSILLLIAIPLLTSSAIMIIFEIISLDKSKTQKEQSLFKFTMVIAKFIAILVGLQMLIVLIFFGLGFLGTMFSTG